MKITAEEIRHKLEWRYATKVFNPNKIISSENWTLLEDALVLSPSSYGLQPWKFLVIENKDIRSKLKAVSWGQGQVTDASHFVVFTTLKEISADFIAGYVKSISEVRGQPSESLTGFQNMMVKNIVEGMDKTSVRTWNQRQAYIAMGFLLESAALLDIDTVAMEGLDPKAYDDLLGLTNSDYGTVAAVALGYRDDSDKYSQATKVRFPKEMIIQKV